MKNQSEKIIALLGPTNTGKTHIAIEKMLKFKNGIFGLPLRLLALKEKVGLIFSGRDICDNCSCNSSRFFLTTCCFLPVVVSALDQQFEEKFFLFTFS